MANFIAVPMKKCWEVEMAGPLRGFIQTTYPDYNIEDFNQALKDFDRLRSQMISKSMDRHESALDVLYRYHDQLVAIEAKLPIAENQIRINFKWQDAFDKETFFGGKNTLSISSAAYEKVCLLFNIAALQSQIGQLQNHESDEGLKMSAKMYQQAAGIYTYLSESVMSLVPQGTTPDLTTDTLTALQLLMLAHAQESYCLKAIADKMKDAVTAKLCNQCSDLYAEAMRQLQMYSIRELWPPNWISVTAGKQAAYHAMAEYHQAMVCQQNHAYGEEIARLQHAKELMQAAVTRGGKEVNFSEKMAKIQRALDSAEKDNNFIYHDKIPSRGNLDPIGKAPVAKAIPIASPMGSDFKDLFEKLVPLNVHQALMTHENKKEQVVQMAVGKLREQTQLMNSVLASLNLPASIEDFSGSDVPPSLMEKAQKVQSEGGINHIAQLMQDLPESLARNREILGEAIKLLDEEQASDDQLRQQFKERWTRTPSIKLTEPIRAEAAKYQGILDNAIKADGIVKAKYSENERAIKLLSNPGELKSALPSASPAAALKDSPTVKELRTLMQQVEAIKAERDAIEMEIKEQKCDMTSKFMAALAQDGAINEESLSAAELDRIYGPLQQQVQESCERQESIMINVERVNMDFCRQRDSNQSAAEREKILKELQSGYDAFRELKGNLEEGTKFYNDLTQLLVKFQNKVTDFCFARKTEKEDMMKDLQSSIANQKTAPTPAAPSYQQPRAPPARPPPPTLPATAQAPPSAPTQAPPSSSYSAPPQGPPTSAPSQAPSSGPPSQLPYPSQPGSQGPAYGAAPYSQPSPYPQYTPMPMPGGYNPYNPYMGHQQQGGYPQQYPQQGAPQYPQQGAPAYPQQGAPPYPQQGGPQYPPQYPPQQGEYPYPQQQWR
ncbi:programmed cell death 6-interacting protein [Lingula anatina]|uniref:Programmed cell death 6-interacting protein n=1 Tax=Lingula anatina TaxID=7574 RepID=A0A1S3IQY0_LINAN|nr:programmed cell death 6-interacting protein [Lingula anatina]|eukprot:XP_013400625.1 programmed cell death 6-interacting protein [Lingula anatina]